MMKEAVILLAGALEPNNCDSAEHWIEYMKTGGKQLDLATPIRDEFETSWEYWVDFTTMEYTILAVPSAERRCKITDGYGWKAVK